MSARNYSSVARATTLTSGVSGASTVFSVTDTAGFPTPPFTLVADPGRVTEEIVTVTATVGLNLTVQRGQDGSGASPHDAGATLRHMATARDYREPADHIDATVGVHGVVGSLVGATDTQVLDNKTFTAISTDHTALKVKAASGQTSPLVVFSDASDVALASVSSTTGRITTPGVEGTSTSTLTAGAASTVPLLVKGAASQSANLQSWRNNSNTELAFISPTGGLNGATLTAGTSTLGELTSTGQSVHTATNTTDTPLTIKTPASHVGTSLAVRDSANALKTGISGASTGFRVFQGDSGNYLPFKMHGGSISVTIPDGATSFTGVIDISSFAYTASPLVYLTVRQSNASTVKRRVAVNIEAVSATSITARVVQTSNEPMVGDELYTVHWMAVNFTPSTGPG